MNKPAALIGVLVLGGVTFGAAGMRRVRVGHPLAKGELRNYDPDILPDGKGLPRGHGTAQQGQPIYMKECASCHGARGEGTDYFPPLVGGQGTLTSHNPLPTVGAYWPYATTVWDFINRAMPYQNPGRLTSNQVYSVTAYILYMNHIIGERETLNKRTLPKVKMPNRHGFVLDPRPDLQ